LDQYSLDFLDKAVKDPAFDPQFKVNVLKNVVSYEDNVKSVVTKVSLGEADAGIVYVTDITADAAKKISQLDIPDSMNTVATYPIAAINRQQERSPARAFVALVLFPEGQAIMAKYGFIPAVGKIKGKNSIFGIFSITWGVVIFCAAFAAQKITISPLLSRRYNFCIFIVKESGLPSKKSSPLIKCIFRRATMRK